MYEYVGLCAMYIVTRPDPRHPRLWQVTQRVLQGGAHRPHRLIAAHAAPAGAAAYGGGLGLHGLDAGQQVVGASTPARPMLLLSGMASGRPPPPPLKRSVLKDSRVRYEDLLEEACDRQLPLFRRDPSPAVAPFGGHRLLMSVVWLSFMSANTAAASTLSSR